MSERVTFFVSGIPAPGGSKKFVGFSRKTGIPILVDDAGKKNRNWRKLVSSEAAKHMAGREPFSGKALHLHCQFIMPRPKAHFRANGKLKDWAPYWHTNIPDATKLTRSTEDAMTGIVWKDDSLIAFQTITKRYHSENGDCGCLISVDVLSHPPVPVIDLDGWQ